MRLWHPLGSTQPIAFICSGSWHECNGVFEGVSLLLVNWGNGAHGVTGGLGWSLGWARLRQEVGSLRPVGRYHTVVVRAEATANETRMVQLGR